mgnify:CR=1 FL=1
MYVEVIYAKLSSNLMRGITIASYKFDKDIKGTVMSANFSVERSLMKAKTHANKGELAEAQKLYQTILKKYSNNIRAQQGLTALDKYKKNNNTQNPPQEIVNQLVNLYNQGQTAAVIRQAEHLTKEYPNAFIVWNILGASRAQIGMLDEAIEAYNTSISLNTSLGLFSDVPFITNTNSFFEGLYINKLSWGSFGNGTSFSNIL